MIQKNIIEKILESKIEQAEGITISEAIEKQVPEYANLIEVSYEVWEAEYKEKTTRVVGTCIKCYAYFEIDMDGAARLDRCYCPSCGKKIKLGEWK